jgi:predicted CoA-binding protein
MSTTFASTVAERIADFMAQKRIAVVGVSRNPAEFSRRMFRDLLRGGYDCVPVHPTAAEMDGIPCISHLKLIQPPVTAAILMTRPEEMDHLVYDCAEAGIGRVWIPLGAGKQPLSPSARTFCEQSGIEVISGFCPYMFLKNAGFFHRLHGFAARHSSAYRMP